jgi:hypothetical protein
MNHASIDQEMRAIAGFTSLSRDEQCKFRAFLLEQKEAEYALNHPPQKRDRSSASRMRLQKDEDEKNRHAQENELMLSFTEQQAKLKLAAENARRSSFDDQLAGLLNCGCQVCDPTGCKNTVSAPPFDVQIHLFARCARDLKKIVEYQDASYAQSLREESSRLSREIETCRAVASLSVTPSGDDGAHLPAFQPVCDVPFMPMVGMEEDGMALSGEYERCSRWLTERSLVEDPCQALNFDSVSQITGSTPPVLFEFSDIYGIFDHVPTTSSNVSLEDL